jgi:sugar lactone lactonase YvrE
MSRWVAALVLSVFVVAWPPSARAAAGDAVADHVLGQIDFQGAAAGFVDGRALHDPSSIAVDRGSTPNHFYVADFDNHRVLGWKNARNFKKGTPADLVIGQVNATSAACNRGGAASDKTLCFPTGLSVDGDGDLYVADSGNSRVLRFASPFTSGLDFDQPAAAVFGQASFTSVSCNRGSGASADTLCSPAGTTVDADGNVYVADGFGGLSFNSRVLEYDDPKAAGGGTPGTSGAAGDKTADRVFGQASFVATSCNRGNAAPDSNTLCAPTDLWIDADGNLIVADKANNRVLVFVDPLTNQVADQVYGQSSFTTKTLGSALNELREPTGVGVDADGRLWIADFNGRVLEFDAPILGSNGRTASRTLGSAGPFPSSKRVIQAADVDFDPAGNVYVADGMQPLSGLEGGDNRVLRFDSPLTTESIADAVLGQKGFATTLPNRIDPRSLSNARGIAFDRSVNPPHVYVVDNGASRVLGWLDATAFANGQAADLVLGQPSFKQHYCNQGVGTPAGANTLCNPTDVAVDAQGRVWVADELNNRVLGYDPPFASGLFADQPASRVLGQANFAGKTANRGGAVGAATLNAPRGLAFDDDGNLWVTDRSNFRVVLFKKPFAQDGNADFVLGQASLTSNTAPSSPSADDMLSPFGVFVDGPGNVYVADGGYNRVLVYLKPLASGGGTPGTPGSKGDRTADRVFGQVSLTAGSGCNQYNGVVGRSAQSLCGPSDVAVDPGGSLWVVDPGSGNHRVLRYDLPLTGNDTADAVLGPADFVSSGSRCADPLRTASGFCFPDSIAFDPDGNAWVSESGGNRVLVFDN